MKVYDDDGFNSLSRVITSYNVHRYILFLLSRNQFTFIYIFILTLYCLNDPFTRNKFQLYTSRFANNSNNQTKAERPYQFLLK